MAGIRWICLVNYQDRDDFEHVTDELNCRNSFIPDTDSSRTSPEVNDWSKDKLPIFQDWSPSRISLGRIAELSTTARICRCCRRTTAQFALPLGCDRDLHDKKSLQSPNALFAGPQSSSRHQPVCQSCRVDAAVFLRSPPNTHNSHPQKQRRSRPSLFFLLFFWSPFSGLKYQKPITIPGTATTFTVKYLRIEQSIHRTFKRRITKFWNIWQCHKLRRRGSKTQRYLTAGWIQLGRRRALKSRGRGWRGKWSGQWLWIPRKRWSIWLFWRRWRWGRLNDLYRGIQHSNSPKWTWWWRKQSWWELRKWSKWPRCRIKVHIQPISFRTGRNFSSANIILWHL